MSAAEDLRERVTKKINQFHHIRGLLQRPQPDGKREGCWSFPEPLGRLTSSATASLTLRGLLAPECRLMG